MTTKLETVAPGITGAAPRVFVGSVAFSNGTEHAEVSPSKRTRWLVFLNAKGQPTMAPGVRTHQLSLLFGMGLDWYKRAMAEPEPTVAERVIDAAVRGSVVLSAKEAERLGYIAGVDTVVVAP